MHATTHTSRTRRRVFGTAVVLLAVAAFVVVGQTTRAQDGDGKVVFVGPENTQGGCLSCHENEVKAWQKTHHYKSADQLEDDKAYEWAEALGIEDDPVESKLCMQCHVSVTQKGVTGVSCESCHGAAEKWVKRHYDFGPGIKPEESDKETPEHRKARYAELDKLGMVRPGRIYSFVSNCQGCHMIPQEKLVNSTAHKATTDGFELVAWTHGEVRHNFLDNKDNPEQPKERKRTYFVAGKIAEVEYGLRGLAMAKEAGGRYETAVKKRVMEAKDSLTKIEAGLSDADAKAQVEAVLDALGGAELKAGNPKPLTEAADKVRQAGEAFATMFADGTKLEGIDGLVPGADKFKGAVYKK